MADKIPEANTESAKARADRLRYLREKLLRVSRAEMEQITGIPESSIENWEYARYSGMTERGAYRLEEACKKIGVNCPAKWLLFGIGKAPGVPTFQPVDSLSDLSQLTQEEIIAEELRLFHRLNKNAIDYIVQDDHLIPFFYPQDIVAGIQIFDHDIEMAINKFCIVKPLMGNISVCKLKKGTKPGYYSLESNQQTSETTLDMANIKLFSAAPILWLRRKSLL